MPGKSVPLHSSLLTILKRNNTHASEQDQTP
jgi:hypothetical protein